MGAQPSLQLPPAPRVPAASHSLCGPQTPLSYHSQYVTTAQKLYLLRVGENQREVMGRWEHKTQRDRQSNGGWGKGMEAWQRNQLLGKLTSEATTCDFGRYLLVRRESLGIVTLKGKFFTNDECPERWDLWGPFEILAATIPSTTVFCSVDTNYSISICPSNFFI